ncbi:MAG: AAA family ATPase [Rhizomicrobium sp.]
MPNFIQTIRLPGTKDVLDLAYPDLDGRNAINVVCGSNNSGKSYLLERTRQFLEKGTQSKPPAVTHQIGIALTEPKSPPPSCQFFGKSWLRKEQLKTIAYQRQHRRPHSSDVLDYASASLTILYFLVADSFAQGNAVPLSKWLDDHELRTRTIGGFPVDEEKLHRGRSTDTLMMEFESIVGGRLYFRRAQENTVDLVLAYGDGTTAHFEEWSDGQKNILLIMALIQQAATQVVLLDEIENHFHPKYITLVLDYLRRNVPQSIVTTHHPHVIFSELVDRVFYLEATRPPFPEGDPPLELRHLKQPAQQAPSRSMHRLIDSFGKVTAIYRLFHDQDRQLIKQAQQIRGDADIIFHTALTRIFLQDIVPAKGGPLPDRQSQQLLTVLRDEFHALAGRPVRLLEIGSGLGRIPADMNKLSPDQVGPSVDWQCWEPNVGVRARLREEIRQKHIRATVLEKLDAATGYFDVCLVANVCHELTPEQFIDVLSVVTSRLRVSEGLLLVQELYPLLNAEKFAVPYSADHMARIVTACGFAVHSLQFPVRDASAYCIVGRKTVDQPDIRTTAATAISAAWNEIERAAIDSYASRSGVSSYEGYSSAVQDMTTIASIAAWRKGRWTASP